jgi:DNA-binding SARP family transcriptional activator
MGRVLTQKPSAPALRLISAPPAPPTPGAPGRCLEPEAGIRGAASPADAVRVGVLGPLAISGALGALQPRQAELVVSLALAGQDGLSASALRNRLGTDPDHPKDPELLRQVITRTRRRLGAGPGGGERIVHDEATGRYRLDLATVQVDLDEFRDLARRGRADRDPRPITRALALLRGPVFDDMYWWWLDTDVIEHVRAEVVDTAVLAARLGLEAGDPVTGRRAALSGLLADSASEELWRQLMLAEDAAGNSAGVHRAWARCRAALADIAVDGEPHPKTIELYQALTASSARPALTPRIPSAAARARLLGAQRGDARAAG